MVSFVIASIVLSVAYIGWTLVSSGKVPESMSAMVYSLPKKQQWVWSFWLAMSSTLLLPRIFSIVPDNGKFVGFLMLVALIGVAVTPIIQQETRNWHNVLGWAAGGLSQACVGIVNPAWLILWVVLGIIIVFYQCAFAKSDDEIASMFGKCGIFILEVMCAFTLYMSLLFQ